MGQHKEHASPQDNVRQSEGHLSGALTSLLANSLPFLTSSLGLMPLRNLASVATAFLPADKQCRCELSESALGVQITAQVSLLIVGHCRAIALCRMARMVFMDFGAY